MTTSNKLTWSRLIAAPLYLLAFLTLGTIGKWLCLLLLGWAAFSDVMDGRLARARGEVSDLGKFLDPIADSTFFVIVFFCFTWAELMAWWMLALIVGREVFQNGILRPYCNARGIVVAAKRIGKAKTVYQSIASMVIVFTLGLYPLIATYVPVRWWELWREACFWLLMVATCLSVGSLLPYVQTMLGTKKSAAA